MPKEIKDMNMFQLLSRFRWVAASMLLSGIAFPASVLVLVQGGSILFGIFLLAFSLGLGISAAGGLISAIVTANDNERAMLEMIENEENS